ncbi:AMP-binding protein [Pseudoalteromonas piscicida]|uniref:AMP-binding protein n=1 Tax=Pseudoalteromonas piscicida TaxID=43662 RepID=UPI00309DC055
MENILDPVLRKQALVKEIQLRKQLAAIATDETATFSQSWKKVISLMPNAVALQGVNTSWHYQQLDSHAQQCYELLGRVPDITDVLILRGSTLSQVLPICMAFWFRAQPVMLQIDSQLPEGTLVLAGQGQLQGIADSIFAASQAINVVEVEHMNAYDKTRSLFSVQGIHTRAQRILKVLGSPKGRRYALTSIQGNDLNTLTCFASLLSGAAIVADPVNVKHCDVLFLPEQAQQMIDSKSENGMSPQGFAACTLLFGTGHRRDFQNALLAVDKKFWQVSQMPEINTEFAIQKYEPGAISSSHVLLPHTVVDSAGVSQPEGVQGRLAIRLTESQTARLYTHSIDAIDKPSVDWYVSELQGVMRGHQFIRAKYSTRWVKSSQWYYLPDLQLRLMQHTLAKELQLVSVVDKLGGLRLLAFFTVEFLEQIKAVSTKIQTLMADIGFTDVIAIHRLSLAKDTLGQVDTARMLQQGLPEFAQPDLGLGDDALSQIEITATQVEYRKAKCPEVKKVGCTSSFLPTSDEPNNEQTSSEKESLLFGADFDLKLANRSLASMLRDTVHRIPNNKIAFICDQKIVTLTYQSLLTHAELRAQKLYYKGLRPGDWIILYISDVEEFVTSFWACQLLGLTCLPQKPDPLKTSQENCASLSSLIQRTPASSVLVDRPLSEQQLPDGISHLVSIPDLMLGECSEVDLQAIVIEPSDTAIVLQTSGSTKQPKLVAQSHRNIVARSLSDAQFNKFTQKDCSLNWMPLDHVGGLVMFHIRDVVSGANQVQVDNAYILQDPERWLQLIDKYDVTITWGPNFAFALLVDCLGRGGHQYDLSSLRFILNGGEAISPEVTKKFMSLVTEMGCADSIMNPAWGMSETCSGVLYNHNLAYRYLDNSQPVCLGWPIPGVNIRITNDEGKVVSHGVAGRLQVQGICVTPGYLDEEDNGVIDDDGWLDTGDLALVTKQGVSIVGRAKDNVIINGVNFSSHYLESVLLNVQGLASAYSCVVGFKHQNAATEQVAVFVCITDGYDTSTVVRDIKRCFQREQRLSVLVVPVETHVIERTSIGKVKRTNMQIRLQGGEFDPLLERFNPEFATLQQRNMLPAWFYKKSVQSSPYSGSSLAQQAPEVICIAAADDCSGYENIVSALVCDHNIIRDIDNTTVHENQHLALLCDENSHIDVQLIDLFRKTKDLSVFRITLVYVGPRLSADACAAVALLKTFTRERPEIVARVVHLHTVSERTLKQLPNEVARLAPQCSELDDSSIKTDALVHYDFSAMTNETLSIKPGHYLVSGGLGTLGLELAQWLTRHFNVSLSLLGRKSEAEIKGTQAWLRLQDMRAQGFNVSYVCADICQYEALSEALSNCAQAPVAGVFHLAAQYEHRQLSEITKADYEQNLSAKTEGTLNLLKWLEANAAELPLFVSYGSVNSYFGGVGAGSYGAACAMQEYYMLNSFYPVRGYYIGWSQWQAGGLASASDLAALAKYRGFSSIETEQGLDSLARILSAPPGSYYVGLDSQHPEIINQSIVPSNGTFLRVNYRVKSAEPPNVLPTKGVDWLGNNFLVSFTADSNQALGQQSHELLAVQTAVSDIWKKVLGTTEIDIHQNLFEAGGTSINLLKLKGELERKFERSIDVTDIFENASIALLSRLLFSAEDKQVSKGLPLEQANKSRLDNRRNSRGNIRRKR